MKFVFVLFPLMLNSLQYHFAVMGLIYISDIGNGITTDSLRNHFGLTACLCFRITMQSYYNFRVCPNETRKNKC